MKKFDPELVLISAGFDGVKGDPLGSAGGGGVVLSEYVFEYFT